MSKRSFSDVVDEDLNDQNSKKHCTCQENGKVKFEKENSHRVQIRSTFNLLKETLQMMVGDIDFCCPLLSDTKVYQDYNCSLLEYDGLTIYYHSGRSVYVLQLLVRSTSYDDQYFVWQRCSSSAGVDGELKGPFFEPEQAVKVFETMFIEKTGNEWSHQKNFHPVPEKCNLRTEYDCWEYTDVLQFIRSAESRRFAPSTLDTDLQQLICLITADFTFEMQKMNLDLKKMPLTHLNLMQIAEGYRILSAIENAIRTKSAVSQLDTLTKYFYKIIPHTARRTQTTLNDLSIVEEKKHLLKILEDIELTTQMQKTRLLDIPWINLLRCEASGLINKVESLFPSVIDLKYEMLGCKLTPIDSNQEISQLIHRSVKNTGRLKVLHIWDIQREEEEMPYAAHDALNNRKLLWHGTHVASVANTLRSGLCINNHLHGRFGTGLYFAPQNSKAANSVSYNVDGQGIMFLCEVALGKEYHITEEDDILTEPPIGFHSVIARGVREPDPAEDAMLTLDGRKVVFPVGTPQVMTEFRQSRFCQSECIVYKESQVRLRYLVQVTYRHLELD